MKMFLLFALTSFGFVAGAHADQHADVVSCSVTSCSPQAPVTPGDCPVTNWTFQIYDDHSVDIGFKEVGGDVAVYYNRGKATTSDGKIFVAMEDPSERINAIIPYECENQRCGIDNNHDSTVVFDARILTGYRRTTYVARCSLANNGGKK